jgi:nitrogen regulatory protein PII
MKPVKRIEIIVPEGQVQKLLDVFEQMKVSGYTVIKNVSGRGDRGLSSGDMLGLFANNYILLACADEQVKPIVEAVRPTLRRFGGVCLVSDAQWVIH